MVHVGVIESMTNCGYDSGSGNYAIALLEEAQKCLENIASL